MAVYAAPSCGGCYGAGCYGGAAYYAGHASAAPAAVSMNAATVVVKAANDVEIKVNGQVTTRRSTEETYSTPALDSGKTYSYVFVAERKVDGKTKTATKEVTVQAGKTTVVDFSDFGTEVVNTTTESAKVTVILPPQGKVYVNDVEMAVSGTRTFETPRLVKGKRYFYTVKADLIKDGKTTTDTRRINIEAGKAITVDFTTKAVQTASR